MSIGVPSGASRRSRVATSFGDADAPVRDGLPERARPVRAVDPDDVGRPVGDSRVGATSPARTSRRTDRSARTRTGRRSHGPAASRSRRRRPRRRCGGAACPSRMRRTSSRRAPSRTTIRFTTGRSSTASALIQPRAPFGWPGQAEPIPPCAVRPAARRQREHDLELVVGPEAAEPANDPGRRPGLRSHRDRAEKLSRGREPRWQVGCESPIGTGCEERNRERRDNRQPSCARSHRTEDSETDGPHAVASVEGPWGSRSTGEARISSGCMTARSLPWLNQLRT